MESGDDGFITPVAPPETKKVYCVECGNGFAKKANLNRHMETKHTDKSSAAFVAKALKLKQYRNINRCARRKNDPIHRKKLLQIKRTAYQNKKACGGTRSDVISTDMVEIDIEDSIEDSQTETESHPVIVGSSSNVKKANNRDKNDGTLHVTTTALTTENVKQFFTPKWSAPRTKEKRKASPRT